MRENRQRGLRVVLRSSLAAACERVELDPSRTFSRDRAFLARHYAEESFSGDLVLDTEQLTVDETVAAVAAAMSAG